MRKGSGNMRRRKRRRDGYKVEARAFRKWRPGGKMRRWMQERREGGREARLKRRGGGREARWKRRECGGHTTAMLALFSFLSWCF